MKNIKAKRKRNQHNMKQSKNVIHHRLNKKGSRIARNISLLRIIAKAKPSDHKAITNSLCNDTIKCIADCSRNILEGRIHLTSTEKNQLSKHRNILRKLSKKATAVNKKNLLLKQKGGFLGLLIKPIISAVKGLIDG